MKTLPNTAKEQRTAIVNFLGQYIANSFNTPVTEYKKAYLLFTFNNRQVIVNTKVNDPPFTIPDTLPTFIPKPYHQDLTKFDINEKDSKNQLVGKELQERENEVDTLMNKLTTLQKELLEKETLLEAKQVKTNNKEQQLNEKEIESYRKELELTEKEVRLNNKEKQLNEHEIQLSEDKNQLIRQQEQLVIIEDTHLEDKETRLNNKMVDIEQKEIQLQTLKKQLKEKEEILNNKEINLKVKETQLNNHINDALLRQNELDGKEKELTKIKEILDTTRQNLSDREKEIETKEKQLNTVDLSDGREPLESPTLSLETINNILYLKWGVIANADNYSINYSFNSKPVDTDDIDFDVKITEKFIFVNLMSFVETGEYEFNIIAIADENNQYKNSLPSKPITHFVFNQSEDQ